MVQQLERLRIIVYNNEVIGTQFTQRVKKTWHVGVVEFVARQKNFSFFVTLFKEQNVTTIRVQVAVTMVSLKFRQRCGYCRLCSPCLMHKILHVYANINSFDSVDDSKCYCLLWEVLIVCQVNLYCLDTSSKLCHYSLEFWKSSLYLHVCFVNCVE